MRTITSFGLLVLVACGEEEKPENSAPTILIESHSDGSQVQDGFVETFRAVVSDDDHSLGALSVGWYVDDDLVCDWATVNPAGESLCEIVFAEGETTVVAEVRDPEGAGTQSQLDILVLPTEAPQIELLTPVSGEYFYADQLLQFSALVSDAEDDLEDLVVSWISSIDGVLSLDDNLDDPSAVGGSVFLSEGNHTIELTAEDTTGKMSVESVAIQVRGPNTVPTCAWSTPTDGAPVEVGSQVSFSGIVDDPDIPNDELSIEVTASLDGVMGTPSPYSDGGFVFDTDALSAGTHTITLTVSDEVGATCTAGMIVPVGYTPEVAIAEPVDDAVITFGELVSMSGTASDADDASETLTMIWSSDIDGELFGGMGSVAGESTFDTTELTAGVHTLTLTATDVIGLVGIDQVTLRVNQLPTVDSIVLNPDPAISNEPLTAVVTSSDLDGQTAILSYEWYENGTLTGFNGNSIDATELQVGETWTVRVTPNDGFQEGAFTESSIEISNTPPTITSAEITPATASVHDELTCLATGTDIDDGALSVDYAWTSTAGTLGTASVLQLDNTMVSGGETITCTATVTDSNGEGATSSSSVTLDNNVPTLASFNLTPSGVIETGGSLYCNAQFTDVEDGSLIPSFEWTVAGVSVSNAQSYTATAAETNVGDIIECSATVIDSDGNTTVESGSVAVFNTLPLVSNVQVTSSDDFNYNTSLYSCTGNVDDLDEHHTAQYVWSAKGVQVGTGPTLDASNIGLLPENTLTCALEVTDDDTGAVVTDATTVGLDNRRPSTPSVSLSWTSTGQGPTVGEDVTCSGMGSVDPDNQAVSYLYTWTNFTTREVVNDQTLGAAHTESGDVWICTVRATDGGLNSEAVSTNTSICGDVDCNANLELGNGVSMDMMLVAGGSFSMGSPDNEVGRGTDEDSYNVTLSEDFYVMSTEVTQGMFSEMMGYSSDEGVSSANSGSYGVGDDFPAYFVNWHMAADFANHVTLRHNMTYDDDLDECYTCSGTGTEVSCVVAMDPYECDGYRLLTEAEWEYAAKAGSNSPFKDSPNTYGIPMGLEDDCSQSWTFGDGSALSDLAWYCGNSDDSLGTGGSKQVATKAANDFGLYDMSGNVFEWTQDWYGTYPTGNSTDPKGVNAGSTRVVRGGDWESTPAGLRTAARAEQPPSTRSKLSGFRIGRSVVLNVTPPVIAMSNPYPPPGQQDLVCNLVSQATCLGYCEVTYHREWKLNGNLVDLADYSDNPSQTFTQAPNDTIPAAALIYGDEWECITIPLIFYPANGQQFLANGSSSSAFAYVGGFPDGSGGNGDGTGGGTGDGNGGDGGNGGDTGGNTGDTGDTDDTGGSNDTGGDTGGNTGDTGDTGNDDDDIICTDCEDMVVDLGNGEELSMVLLPADTFHVGSLAAEIGHETNELRHHVTLTNEFFIMDTEVTQGMFAALMGYNSYQGELLSTFSGYSFGLGDNHPAYYVSWDMAAAFANEVTVRHNTLLGTSFDECYTCSGSGPSVDCEVEVPAYDCNGFRLPTEAEWEYAARSGTEESFWTPNGGTSIPGSWGVLGSGTGVVSGSVLASSCTLQWSWGSGMTMLDYAWYCGNSDYNATDFGTKEVASLEPNGFGLYDMHGNVWEWTQDRFEMFSDQPVVNPIGTAEGAPRVLRGGGWMGIPQDLRAANRKSFDGSSKYNNIGFRLVLADPVQPSTPEVDIDLQSSLIGQEDLYCEMTVSSVDPQGDTVTYTFEWTVDGVPYTGATQTTMYPNDTINASIPNIGETWECILTPNDGTQDAGSVTDSVTLCALTDCDASVDLSDGIGADMVLIPSGEDPLGRYELTRDFYMMTTEVTQGMWNQLLSFDPMAYGGAYTGLGPNYPVRYVSWLNAAAYANAMTAWHNATYGTSLQACYSCSNLNDFYPNCSLVSNPYQCDGYVLPTEAEWEYAARSGTEYNFWTPNGGGELNASYEIEDGVNNPLLSTFARFADDGYPLNVVSEVATLEPNGFGLYDTAGNVFEWNNHWSDTFPDSSVDPYPLDQSGYRSFRGGGWNTIDYHLELETRNYIPLDYFDEQMGFRLVRHIQP